MPVALPQWIDGEMQYNDNYWQCDDKLYYTCVRGSIHLMFNSFYPAMVQ